MEKAREALEKEVDIVRLVRSRRFVHMALKHLLDPKTRKEMKVRCQLQAVEISPDSSSAAKLDKVSKERSCAYDTSGQLSANQEASSVEMMN